MNGSHIQVRLKQTTITNSYANRLGGTNVTPGDLYELEQIRQRDGKPGHTNVIWRNPQPKMLPGEELMTGGLKADLAISRSGDAILMLLYEWNWLSVYQIPTNAVSADAFAASPS